MGSAIPGPCGPRAAPGTAMVEDRHPSRGGKPGSGTRSLAVLSAWCQTASRDSNVGRWTARGPEDEHGPPKHKGVVAVAAPVHTE